LKRLASLERKKIEQEYRELLDLVKTLQGLLKSEAKRRVVVENELRDIRAKYADRRKTQIVRLKQGKALVDTAVLKDVTPLEKVWITLSTENRLMKYREASPPRTGGKDAPKIIFTADSHQTLYLVNSTGKCAAINLHSILYSDEAPNGSDLTKVSAFREDEKVITAFCVSNDMRKNKELTIITITTQGLIKQSLVSELPGPTAELFTLVKVNEGDAFLSSSFLLGEQEIFILTKEGMGIRFSSQEVRIMGLIAAGVNALKLASGDQVVGMTLMNGKSELLLVANDGSGWRMEEDAFPTQGRYGAGVIAAKLTSGNKLIGLAYGKKNHQINLHMHKAAAKTIRIDQIPTGKRATSGKKLIEVKSGDSIIAVVSCEDYLDSISMQPVRARKKSAK
jgi:DNA gyrase subunit A